ncbi:uncharacterized protein LOC134246755 [Saccostrea cucullata]|uniref:uncharacterized protein LOC134246755 n=1 Tax=Saccostrea cuccullata TaxID=36930 RepID=UPI002ED5C4A5
MAKDLPPEKRYVALLHDEMKVKADLVYDKRSGQIIGFTNPETWTFNEDEVSKIATHVLVFMVVGINSHIKMSIGHFPTRTSTADELYPLFWRAVAYLEITCGLKVITSTSDKASPNQRLYRLHRVGNEPVVYKAKNEFAEDEERYLYFISDVPHLVKTIRNNISKSKPGGTKYLWNNNKNILWSHVTQLYNDDMARQLYRTKLTYDHVYLTPSSTMSVKLAVQVLSSSVARVMEAYYGPQMSETATLFKLVDRFFDCLNGRSLKESAFTRKPDVAPYKSLNDPRFQFLEHEFLQYFERWLQAVRARPGFTKAEQNKMFISFQTHEGIIMTVKAFVEATKYLLQHNLPYVLSNDFCQDPLEEHFGRHRRLGANQDNPTVHQFSYQENKLRLQRSLAFQFVPKGNTGPQGQKRPVVVSNSPLKKRRN